MTDFQSDRVKGLERPHLIGLAGPGFNHAWTIPKASAHCVEAQQDDYIKGICCPGTLDVSPGRTQLDRAAFFCHQNYMMSLIFEMLQCCKYYLIIFHGYRNKEYLHWNINKKVVLSLLCIGSDCYTLAEDDC